MAMAKTRYRPVARLEAALSSSSELLLEPPVDCGRAAVAVAASLTAALAFSRGAWHWLSIWGDATYGDDVSG